MSNIDTIDAQLASSTKPSYCEGSFRDPEGRVFELSGKILRTVTQDALPRIKKLIDSTFFKDLVAENLLIPTKIVTCSSLGLSSEIGTYVLEHEKIHVISLPYEWSFDMLKEAALVHLRILELCLANGYILKDGTAFNIAYRNGKMCFIDLLSFDTYQKGQPWEGYAQFCQEFLIPLMLTSYKGVAFHAWWRGTLKGISLSDFKKILSIRDYSRPGIFKHIVIQDFLDQAFSKEKISLKSSTTGPILSEKIISKLIKNLRSVIERLELKSNHSKWITYSNSNSYTDNDQKFKEAFVSDGIRQLQPRNVVDLGANTGYYSMIAAKYCNQVVSLDLDPACTNRMFLQIKNNIVQNKIIPIVVDLMNPSPSQGWMLKERNNILTRIQSDFFLALAVIHHICITSNVPLNYFVLMLKSISKTGIVEWVDQEDQMVQFMLRNRKNIFKEYTWKNFELALQEHFKVLDVVELQRGTRKLCLLGMK